MGADGHFYPGVNWVRGIGLAIILLTSLVQSLSPQHGFPYFVLLVVESLLALVWGAWRRVKDSSERERKTAVRPMWSLPN